MNTWTFSDVYRAEMQRLSQDMVRQEIAVRNTMLLKDGRRVLFVDRAYSDPALRLPEGF